MITHYKYNLFCIFCGCALEESTVNSLINVINRYSEIGKAVTSFIGEITSNSVIGGK
jgi:hypothetical protein